MEKRYLCLPEPSTCHMYMLGRAHVCPLGNIQRLGTSVVLDAVSAQLLREAGGKGPTPNSEKNGSLGLTSGKHR